MAAYERVSESPLLLRRRGTSPRRYAQWFLWPGVAMLALSLAFVGVGDLFIMLECGGGIFAISGAFLLGMADGTATWIIQQPHKVEVRAASQGGKVVAVADAVIPGENVRRIEVHAVAVSDRPGRISREFVVAIVAVNRVVELSFRAEADARAIALVLCEQLPHVGEVRERVRPLFRAYGIAGALVIFAACICVVGCWLWLMFTGAQNALDALPAVAIIGLDVLVTYYAARSIAPDTTRRMVEDEYGVSP